MQCLPGRVEYLNAICQSSDQVMRLSWMMRKDLNIEYLFISSSIIFVYFIPAAAAPVSRILHPLQLSITQSFVKVGKFCLPFS